MASVFGGREVVVRVFYYAKFMETDVFARALALTSGAFCSGTENRVRQNNAAAADPTNRARKRGGAWGGWVGA